MEKEKFFFKVCEDCQGLGKKKRRIKKSIRLRYEADLERFKQDNTKEHPPEKPEAARYTCPSCNGSGLSKSEHFPVDDTENYPHIAIIGAGIGGVALAVACLHRGIPFTLYERDHRFDSRSQGYGLTLQQASKAIDGFGISTLAEGVVSTRHLVHTPDGKVVGEWGMRKWLEADNETKANKRTNIHIARQSLRLTLLQQLGDKNVVRWDHQLINVTKSSDGNMELDFEINGVSKKASADLVVGADGIRSAVRKLMIGEQKFPLRYLDCIVILGICPLSALQNSESDLLDSATVFQTANGNERIYMMPFDEKSVMWQLSFPLSENDAKALSAKGPKALKEEAALRTKWHTPIPQIIAATNEAQISGYPVYDRDLLTAETLENLGAITLIGDAAHPMSPFKGQGANQALLDALSLARAIFKNCKPFSHWREKGIRPSVLNEFENEMLARSANKVQDSAAAAQFLHSEVALYEGNEPRGRVLKRENEI